MEKYEVRILLTILVAVSLWWTSGNVWFTAAVSAFLLFTAIRISYESRMLPDEGRNRTLRNVAKYTPTGVLVLAGVMFIYGLIIVPILLVVGSCVDFIWEYTVWNSRKT